MPFPKQKKPLGRASEPQSSKDSADPRFASLSTDPRFRLPSKKHTRTKLDKRFGRILKDDDFSKKASVDRYGRKLSRDAGRKELERLYKLEDEDEHDEDENEGSSDDSGDDEVDVRRELKRMDKKYDPARDGGFSESSSSEEESSDEDEVEEAELYATEEQVASIPTGDVTRRIAVVNMDWDNIRAEDIMAVAISFLPAEGRIESVTVYPSEFGRERMEREEMEGPPKEIFASAKKHESDESVSGSEEEDSDEEEERIKKTLLKEDTGEEYNSTALRKYQLDRLRYFYAIIECSSLEAAKAVYDNMDGREYLSSANFFDLRFVPDDVTFDEKPRESCTDVPRDYKPNDFVTDALRHSKVKLTWDAEDRKRKEVQKRAFSRKEIDENDLQAYIGSASSSDEEEEEEDEPIPEGVDIDTMSMVSKSTVNRQARREALRAALGLDSEPALARKSRKKDDGPVGNMEISFTPGISAAEKKDSVFENDPRDAEETTLERYVRRERERKKRRKERMKARREGRDPDAVAASDGEDATNGAAAEPKDDLGFDDPFFTDPLYAEKAQKKAKKEAKAARKAEEAAQEAASAAQRAELELLMADDEQQGIRHFDMREVRKAEKAKASKHKSKKGKKGKDDAVAQDDFKMDTQDPRFAKLFESHEFAIDPTNPRFKKTEGMKQLMEESIKKRGKRGEGEAVGGDAKRNEKRVRSDGAELSALVEKVKKRART
ncbi:uncharacterized protein PV09_06714 [Verruconis gallopava]|uniref:Uncharacterized protein n=1 Tax=Verruconis gallopava TaxID=253628 RepID=A0A0D2A5P5_9PEZI|nr:uncharacterized protein PV09_06714 [Verruconis gallopava]KIW01865.1 hypothetical protein PV09_06714 [Verruconis gallopava]